MVEIRDGKTSTEIIENRTDHGGVSKDAFLMLDSAGRVQIPRHALERLSIGNRVRFDITENQIILEPVEEHRRTKPVAKNEEWDAFFIEETQEKPIHKTSFLKRIFKKRKDD